LGVATPSNVRRELGQRYPWLEEAFAKALSQTSTPGSPFIAPDAFRSVQFAEKFVQAIQTTTEPPPSDAASFLELKDLKGPSKTWERTHWIDGERLEQDLDTKLDDDFIEDSVDLPRIRIRDGVLRRTAQFVAVVDSDRRFRGLVDRHALLEQVGTSNREVTDPRPSAS
jgi:hypothetical protein